MYVSKREEEGRGKTRRERDENSAGAHTPAGGNMYNAVSH